MRSFYSSKATCRQATKQQAALNDEEQCSGDLIACPAAKGCTMACEWVRLEVGCVLTVRASTTRLAVCYGEGGDSRFLGVDFSMMVVLLRAAGDWTISASYSRLENTCMIEKQDLEVLLPAFYLLQLLPQGLQR